MLPQEVELLPENVLIVFRGGRYATYGKKVRYYAEKHLIERTKIPAPQMPRTPALRRVLTDLVRVGSGLRANQRGALAHCRTLQTHSSVPSVKAGEQLPLRVLAASFTLLRRG